MSCLSIEIVYFRICVQLLDFIVYLYIYVDFANRIGAFILWPLIWWNDLLVFLIWTQSSSCLRTMIKLARENSILCVWVNIGWVGRAVGLLSNLRKILCVTDFLLSVVVKYLIRWFNEITTSWVSSGGHINDVRILSFHAEFYLKEW